MEKLSGLDSTGKYLLMQAHDFAKRSRHELTFHNPNGEVREFLEYASRFNKIHIVG